MIALSGDWIAQRGPIPAFPAGGSEGPIAFETAGLGQWDTGLIEFLWEGKRAARQEGRIFDDHGLPEPARELLALLPDAQVACGPAKRAGFRPLYWLGGRTVDVLTEAGALSEMLANSTTGTLAAVVGRVRMRAVDLTQNVGDAGPSALTIVGVVNFLIGAILAFVGAVQLRKFAADVFVADLVGLAVVREMASVMTAIIMSGRTGGAYAARIATMRGNEELDALSVVGIPVAEYIILPAVLALAITMPLLYLYGCLLGMMGGWIVAVAMLNITTLGFVHQIVDAVPIGQFLFGFVKSLAFAIMIGLTSCRIGLLAGRSAADVGTAATRAVVIGIVGVIVMDAVFAVLAEVVGI